MSGAGDALLTEQPPYDTIDPAETLSDVSSLEISTRLGNDGQNRANREDTGFRKEDVNTEYDGDDGPSSSSDRLISGPFQIMEPEVIVLHPSKHKGIVWKIAFMLLGVLIGTLLSILWRTAVRTAKSPSTQANWKGWQSVEYAFVL
jgi:hypothetical protein